MDRYYVRTSIQRALMGSLPLLNGRLLDIGAGSMPYRQFILENSSVNQYVGLDIETALIYDDTIKPDVTWDGITMPFDKNSFDCAFGTEVLEHCPNPTGVLKETFRVLKPGGVFFFTVPFLWNLHEVPNDEYRYTPFSLERHLSESGFKDIHIHATGGWHASMAQLIGLWIKRSPIKRRNRKILSFVAIPIMKFLLRQDEKYPVEFKEGQMITGMWGLAWKRQ